MKKILVILSAVLFLIPLLKAEAYVDIDLEKHVLTFNEGYRDDLRDTFDQSGDSKILKMLRMMHPSIYNEILKLLKEKDLRPYIRYQVAESYYMRSKDRDLHLRDLIDSLNFYVESRDAIRGIDFINDYYKNSTNYLLYLIVSVDGRAVNKDKFFVHFNELLVLLGSGNYYKSGLKINTLLKSLY